jgi:hypothetical protein
MLKNIIRDMSHKRPACCLNVPSYVSLPGEMLELSLLAMLHVLSSNVSSLGPLLCSVLITWAYELGIISCARDSILKCHHTFIQHLQSYAWQDSAQ